MERVLKKVNPELLEKLKKSSVPLDSESMKQLSPELLEKVSGGGTFQLDGACLSCGGAVYYWSIDDPDDWVSEGIFCGTCGRIYGAHGNFDINVAMNQI